MRTSPTSSPSSPRIWARAILAAACLAAASALAEAPAPGSDETAARAKRGVFDARARAPCAQIEGEALGICAVAVARGGDGRATVVATFANGFSRTLHFAGGAFLRANATMSGVGTDIDWRLEEGVHRIRVDDQRFELPDALLFGG